MSLSYSTQRLAVGHSKSHLNCRPYATLQSPLGTSTAASSCGDGDTHIPLSPSALKATWQALSPSARRTPNETQGIFRLICTEKIALGRNRNQRRAGYKRWRRKKSLFRVRIQAIAARYLVTQQDQLSEIKLDRRASKCESWRACIHTSSPKNTKASLGRGDPNTRHLTPWIRQRFDCSLTRRRGETRLGNDSRALFRLARFGELAADSRA